MTRLEITNEVRENIKRTSTAFANSRITTFIDWAQQRVANVHTFEEMRTSDTFLTTTSVTNYTFPDRMKDIYSITVQDEGNSRKLIYVHPRNFDSLIPRPATYSEGLPSWYVDYGTRFELFAIPNSEYTCNRRYSEYPQSLTNDNMASDLLNKDALLVAGATAFGFWALREIEDAEYWQNVVYKQLLVEAVGTDHSAEDYAPVARGFSTAASSGNIAGNWWENPFTGRR